MPTDPGILYVRYLKAYSIVRIGGSLGSEDFSGALSQNDPSIASALALGVLDAGASGPPSPRTRKDLVAEVQRMVEA